MTGDDVAPKGRPQVWINCAMSLDGKLAFEGGKRAMLSGPQDLSRVQQIRSTSDAIMVGVGTVLNDNPSLRVHWDLMPKRPGARHDPIRVVLDSAGRTPPKSHVLDGSARTVIITARQCRRKFPKHVVHAKLGNVHVDLLGALRWLRNEMGVHTLMVEGGSEVITSFLRGNLADRMTVFIAPVAIGGRRAPQIVGGEGSLDQKHLVRLRMKSARMLDDGVLLSFEKM